MLYQASAWAMCANILLVRVSHRTTSYSRDRKIDSFSLIRGSHKAKAVDTERGEVLGPLNQSVAEENQLGSDSRFATNELYP